VLTVVMIYAIVVLAVAVAAFVSGAVPSSWHLLRTLWAHWLPAG
jgi:hypothetical protein